MYSDYLFTKFAAENRKKELRPNQYAGIGAAAAGTGILGYLGGSYVGNKLNNAIDNTSKLNNKLMPKLRDINNKIEYQAYDDFLDPRMGDRLRRRSDKLTNLSSKVDKRLKYLNRFKNIARFGTPALAAGLGGLAAYKLTDHA